MDTPRVRGSRLDSRAAMRAMLEWVDANQAKIETAFQALADEAEQSAYAEDDAENTANAALALTSRDRWLSIKEEFTRLAEALPEDLFI